MYNLRHEKKGMLLLTAPSANEVARIVLDDLHLEFRENYKKYGLSSAIDISATATVQLIRGLDLTLPFTFDTFWIRRWLQDLPEVIESTQSQPTGYWALRRYSWERLFDFQLLGVNGMKVDKAGFSIPLYDSWQVPEDGGVPMGSAIGALLTVAYLSDGVLQQSSASPIHDVVREAVLSALPDCLMAYALGELLRNEPELFQTWKAKCFHVLVGSSERSPVLIGSLKGKKWVPVTDYVHARSWD
jgi:hypothetical protein